MIVTQRPATFTSPTTVQLEPDEVSLLADILLRAARGLDLDHLTEEDKVQADIIAEQLDEVM